MKIGFIGLGTMGKSMAVNLLKAGHSLIIKQRNNKSQDILINQGAILSNSYAEIANQCEVVITMLPESKDVEDVVFGKNGIIHGAKSGMLFIDMSSIPPNVSIKINELLKDKGVYSLDAPVSGGPQGAENGNLSIMVGGIKEAFEKGLPILKVLGSKILHMGSAGSGQTTKLCNQILIGVHIQAVAEAFVLAKKSGLDLIKVREALLGGIAYSKVLELHGQKIIDRTFDKPVFKLKLHRKDLATALEAGKNISVPLYATAIVVQQMDAAITNGNADLDHTSIVLVEEQLSNI